MNVQELATARRNPQGIPHYDLSWQCIITCHDINAMLGAGVYPQHLAIQKQEIPVSISYLLSGALCVGQLHSNLELCHIISQNS